MQDENKTEAAETENGFDRRAFFVRLGLGSLGIATAGTAAFAYQYLSPSVLFEPSPIINAGKPESYPVDSVTLDANSGIYLIHSQEGFFALSAICTHLGCLTAWKPELGIIACPCHGSKFSVFDPKRIPGQKIEGPAPKPLPWLRTWVSDEGDLMIDRSVNISPMQFVRV
jgi:cytochrome b6-f complex iron-sulfur subunit